VGVRRWNNQYIAKSGSYLCKRRYVHRQTDNDQRLRKYHQSPRRCNAHSGSDRLRLPATGSPGCAPQTVSFSNTSTGATSYNWSFPGGTPPASSDTNPVVVYDLPGTVHGHACCHKQFRNRHCHRGYHGWYSTGAGFNSSTNGTLATFTNTTTNGMSYSWDFGDGSASTETDPAHTYSADGVYTVVLTATNACGSSTVTQTVTIRHPAFGRVYGRAAHRMSGTYGSV
jgi:hypothetical protein